MPKYNWQDGVFLFQIIVWYVGYEWQDLHSVFQLIVRYHWQDPLGVFKLIFRYVKCNFDEQDQLGVFQLGNRFIFRWVLGDQLPASWSAPYSRERVPVSFGYFLSSFCTDFFCWCLSFRTSSFSGSFSSEETKTSSIYLKNIPDAYLATEDILFLQVVVR